MHPIAEGDTVTMCDVLEEEAALEDDAAAVLGPADHKNCSYMSGGQCYSISGMYSQRCIATRIEPGCRFPLDKEVGDCLSSC